MVSDGLSVPNLTDATEAHADWVELYAIKDSDGNASFSDLATAFGISGSVDALDDDEWEDERETLTDDDRCEAASEGAFLEIAYRADSCGGDGKAYPFAVTRNAIARQCDTRQSAYVFLLMLSCFCHKTAARRNGAKLFEELCAAAAESYLGGEHSDVRSYVFGFPRRIGPRGFAGAVDDLCEKLGEGQGHRRRPDSIHQKDAKLDVVAWRSFADGRQGKLIAFGQCATGANWVDKIHELPQTLDWCRYWMQDTPGVAPVRMFFVPHRVAERRWFRTCVEGGILFDRCRIVQHAARVGDGLLERLTAWTEAAIRAHLR